MKTSHWFTNIKKVLHILKRVKKPKKGIVETVQKTETKKLFSGLQIDLFSSNKFSVKKQTFFAKRLSFLIRAGVPMLESVSVIRQQTKSKGEIRIFDRVIADVANGQTLAGSLGKFRGVFGNFAINLIKAGESSGTLTENLAYLADELKKKEMLRKKIIGAMLYPIIILIATFGITGFLALYIFPKILPVFKGLHTKLPASTRIVIYVTEMLRNNGVYIFLGITLITVSIVLLLKKSDKAKFLFDGLLLRMPLIGHIIKNYNLTNITRTLGLLLRSGVSLNEALSITSNTTENLQYKKFFNDALNEVTKGKNISETINRSPDLFPAMIGHMIAIGEKSGNLSNTLIYLSEFYENEFEDLTKNLSSAIEPIMMIVMGIMVGFIAISIITPIYSITQGLHA